MAVGEPVNGGPDLMVYYYGNKSYNRGYKQYELTNHLGNVLATISDRKFGISSDTSSLISYYEPDIVTAQDYYPFGMMSRVALPNSGVPYKFGFNGKWNDNEVKGLGNQLNYGDRVLDTRVGRFLSLDPLQTKFPFLTPYQFSSNSPIDGVDLDGKERVDFRLTLKDGAPQLTVTGQGPTSYSSFGRETPIPMYFRIEYQGKHYLFSDAPGVREYGNDRAISHSEGGAINAPVYPLEAMTRFYSQPTTFTSTEDKKNSELHDHLVLNYKMVLFSGMATPRNVSKTPNSQVTEQAVAAQNGNNEIIESTTGSSASNTTTLTGNTATINNTVRASTARASGMANPNTRAAAALGNQVHYDQLNGGTGVGLPTELQNRYPQTQFIFTRRGQAGADVKYVGGVHPSQYPGSTWNPNNDYGDFKPASTSGTRTFNRDINKGKLPTNTQNLPYNTTTGHLQ